MLPLLSCFPVRFIAALFGALVVLSACTETLDIAADVDPAIERADYPTLVPAEQIIGPAPQDSEADLRVADALTGRVAGLQSRARQLRAASPIDSETRRRLGDDSEDD